MKINFREQEKIIYCDIGYDGKKFIGHASCHPDDQDIFSARFGEEIAHKRATVKVLKYIQQKIKFEMKTLDEIYHRLEANKEFDPNSFYARKMRKEIYMREAERADTATAIIALEADIKATILAHNSVQNKIHSNRTK